MGIMMNRKITNSFLFLAILFLSSASILAQNTNDARVKIEAELRLTDEVIDRAREVVRTASAPGPSLVLEKAIELQKQAWDNFSNDRPLIAIALTQKARELAKQSMAGSRILEEGKEAVQNRLERAEELLVQAHDEMPANVDESLQSIFETARRNLAQAWEFFRNGQYRPAVKLANQVEKAAKRLLQIANRQSSFEANFERRLEAVRLFISRVQEEVANCQSEPAKEFIRKARETLEAAVELNSKGNFEQASKQLQQARKLARQAADLCGQARKLADRLQQLTNEAERLKEQIRPSDETGTRIVDQIFDQLENARSFIAKNDSQGASAALRAAQLTIKQLQRYLINGEI